MFLSVYVVQDIYPWNFKLRHYPYTEVVNNLPFARTFKNTMCMKTKTIFLFSLLSISILILMPAWRSPVFRSSSTVHSPVTTKHYLYVAVPGIRDYLGYGGHGIIVFDMDNNHRF